MLYPSFSDYSSIIRYPQIAFKKKDPQTRQERDLEPILVNGKPVESLQNGTKSLWFAAGGFACVFKFETSSPQKFWAVRCFKKSTDDVALHYKKVANNLRSIQGSSCFSYFIEFSFLEEGIRVNGNCYPLLRMEWIEGKDLKTYIQNNLNNSNQLKTLAKAWLDLCTELVNAGIAHGDLQHGNILVDDENGLKIKLIDYDSLYFPTDGSNVDDQIKGLQGYQHPLRDSLQKQCRELDFFSQWVIYVSIIALAEKSRQIFIQL